MSANTQPIYSRAPDIQWVPGYMTAANTTADLTSGTIYLAFTADATNGGWLKEITFKGTPAGTTTTTVARIWLNNGATTGTATNNAFLTDITLPANAPSIVAEVPQYVKPMNLPLPAGYRVYITLGTASANGWQATANAGKY